MPPVFSKNAWKFLLTIKWIQAILFVVSVLFGLLIEPIIGEIVSPHINTTNRIIVTELALIAIIILVALNAALAFHVTNDARRKELQKQVETISQSVGLRAEFLHESGGEPGRDAYTIVRQLVGAAQEELLILDHRPTLTSSRFYDQTPPQSPSRKQYYDEMTRKATSRTHAGAYFRYKRIVQLDEGPTNKWNTAVNTDTCFADHCRQILTFRASTPKAVSTIKTSRVFFPKSSIVIVDGKRVLMEVAIIGPDGSARVEGDLVFYDPEGKFAGPLRQLFEHIDGQSTLLEQVV